MIQFNVDLLRLKSDGDRTVVLKSGCILEGFFFFNFPDDFTVQLGFRATGIRRKHIDKMTKGQKQK